MFNTECCVKRMACNSEMMPERSDAPMRARNFPEMFDAASSSNLPNFRLFATTRLTSATTDSDHCTTLSTRLSTCLNVTVYRNGASPGETGLRGGGDGNGKPPTSCRRNRCLRTIRAMAPEQTRVLEWLADRRTGRMRRALILTTYVSIRCEQSNTDRYTY
jgi:hypothetical protein